MRTRLTMTMFTMRTGLVMTVSTTRMGSTMTLSMDISIRFGPCSAWPDGCNTPNAAARFASAFLPVSDLSRFMALSAATDALHSAFEAKEHEHPPPPAPPRPHHVIPPDRRRVRICTHLIGLEEWKRLVELAPYCRPVGILGKLRQLQAVLAVSSNMACASSLPPPNAN